MKEARLRILEMLENGKITAEEAARLLETIQKGGREKFGEGEGFDRDAFEEKFRDFAKNAEKFAREFGAKATVVYKDVEPKLKKATKVVVEKTACLFDELAKNLNETVKKFEEEIKAETCFDGEDCDCDDTPKEN
jgi:polyhydroxyalkanoate synthesis regulator phasin